MSRKKKKKKTQMKISSIIKKLLYSFIHLTLNSFYFFLCGRFKHLPASSSSFIHFLCVWSRKKQLFSHRLRAGNRNVNIDYHSIFHLSFGLKWFLFNASRIYFSFISSFFSAFSFTNFSFFLCFFLLSFSSLFCKSHYYVLLLYLKLSLCLCFSVCVTCKLPTRISLYFCFI